MCELLGLSFNQPASPSLSFKGFRYRGESNPHGWGLAFYPDESAQIVKEPIKAGGSPLSKFIKSYPRIKSKIFIAHVRYTSGTSITHKNTHPFQRVLNGKEFVFAHNGTLHNYRGLDVRRFAPVGETDSEYAFCHILKSIEERDTNRWDEENFIWFWEKLKEINNYGNFNCLFSDGEYLFCYYDKNGYKGLCFIHRKAPYSRVRLLDEDFEINLAEEKEPTQTGFIIATRRLTDERWENFNFGELIVFKNGKIVFSSHGRKTDSFLSSLSDMEVNILRVLRKSSHRVSLRVICENLSSTGEEIKPAIHSLLCKGFIRQDRRDRDKWNHNNATFYTEPSEREEIDRMISK